MTNTMLAGLSLIDTTGLAILATTVTMLVLGIVANLWLRVRYAGLEKDLRRSRGTEATFSHPVLNRIVLDASEVAQLSREPNLQAVIEDRFHSDLKPMLFAERFVRSATGLVIILGLLGTFYGLTLSIGRIVHLVSAETGAGTDAALGVSQGLTNALVGVLSAVILTIIGVLSNVSDRRTAVMIQIETYLDRICAQAGGALEPGLAGFGDSVARLDGAVARFEAALQSFSSTTRDFHEFNAHLKDNVQRLSLTFADLSDSMKAQFGATIPGRKL